MTLISIVLSLFFALLFSAILVYGFRRRTTGPFDGMLFLFLIIFMFTWGLGSWMTPIGPVFGGVAWLSYLVISIVVMLLIGAMLPPAEGPRRRRVSAEEGGTKVVGITFGVFFWFMLIALFIIALLRLMNPEYQMI